MNSRPTSFLPNSIGTPFMNALQFRTAATLVLSIILMTGCGKKTENNAAGKPAQTDAAKADATNPSQKEKAPAGEAKEHAEEKGLVLSAEEISVAGIRVALLQEQVVSDQLAVTATITANQDKLARVAPRVPGRLAKVMVNLGDNVRQGQPMALIDSIEVGEARSAYAQAASERGLAKANLDRAEKLYADQIIAQKDYLRARAESEKANAVLRAAGEKQQAYLAQSDKPLFSVADLSTVWIETNLFEKDIGRVKVGAPATVTVTAYPGETFKGKVTYISSVMDKESRTIKARVDVPNADGRLKLEMFATASITTSGSSKALLVPDEAVVLIQGQPTAFVQERDGFEARPVELGDKLRGQVALKSGIKAGEKVVVSGAYALKAKMLKSQISAE